MFRRFHFESNRSEIESGSVWYLQGQSFRARVFGISTTQLLSVHLLSKLVKNCTNKWVYMCVCVCLRCKMQEVLCVHVQNLTFNSTALPHIVKHKMCVYVSVCQSRFSNSMWCHSRCSGHHRLFEVILRIQNVLKSIRGKDCSELRGGRSLGHV